ncbi:Uncharacterised protein [Mycobacteroides abscessus subsp. abscessus]|nr:Uncharacterised protein [Mycobacteroides abscessus subsp. abscessus]
MISDLTAIGAEDRCEPLGMLICPLWVNGDNMALNSGEPTTARPRLDALAL